MRRDPVRTNFLENTGAYLWQKAAWAAGERRTASGPAELDRAIPPSLEDASAVWPARIDPCSRVRWSATTRIMAATRSPLLSGRGTTVAVAVNTSARSCVEVPTDVAAMLRSPTPSSGLGSLNIYGSNPDPDDAVIALVRHGLLDMTRGPDLRLWGIRREPFVALGAGPDDAAVVTNLLTGRFLRVDPVTADLINSLRTPAPLGEPLSSPVRTLVHAGVLRLTGER